MLVISFTAYSQVEKGDFSGTANVSFNSIKTDGGGDATNSSVILVRGGYFFSDNVEAGALVLVAGSGGSNTTGIGPYVVYNVLTDGGKILPYIGANFLSLSAGDADPINTLGGVGGIKYFLTEVVNIDTNLNYTSFLGDIKGSQLTLNIGIGINFGKLK